MKNINKFLLLIVLIPFFIFFVYQKYEEKENEIIFDIVDLIIFEIKNKEVSEYQKELFFNKFIDAKNIINQNSNDYASNNNFYAWLEIASIQKAIGDYERAEKLWIWFTDIYSHNSVSPANLGDLYKSFIINKEKSEKYYRIALERDKHDFNIYHGLFELYRYRFNDSNKAIEVLREGIENNPDNTKYTQVLDKYLLELDNN